MGDIELVCVPKYEVTQTDLFGQAAGQVSCLDQILAEMVETWLDFVPGKKNGPKQKTFGIYAPACRKVDQG